MSKKRNKNQHYVATHLDDKLMEALLKLCKAKHPNRHSCISEILRECVDWAYKPLLAHYFSTPLSKSGTPDGDINQQLPTDNYTQGGGLDAS